MAKQTSKKVTVTSTYAGTDTSVEAIAVAHRAIYNEWYKPDLPEWVTAQQIYDAVLPVAGETPDADETRADAMNELLPAWIEAHEGVEQAKEDVATVNKVSANVGNAVAIASGAKFSKELNEALDHIADIKEEWDGAPLMLRELALQSFSIEEICSWPKPSSRYDAPETLGTDGDGNPVPNEKHPGYAWYGLKPGSNRPLRDPDFYHDQAKDAKSSFYVDQWDGSANGAKFFRVRDLLGKAKEAFSLMTQEDRKLLAEMTGFTADALQIETNWENADKRNKGRRTSEVGKWRTMVAFVQKCAEIEQELPAVGWSFARDSNGNEFSIDQLATMKKPLQLLIKAKNKNGNWEVVGPTPTLSLSDFAKLNVEKAKAKGGTAGDLKGTVGKRNKPTEKDTAQGGGKDKEGTGIGAVSNAKQLESTLNQINGYFETDASDLEVKKWISKLSDEQVETIADWKQNADSLYNMVKMRWENIMRNKTNAGPTTVMDQLKRSVANA